MTTPLASVDLGIVARRDDPLGDGRIKIRIPGIIEPETPNWCEELGGTSGGGAQRGTFDPPDVGATVGVLFHRGDPDRVFWLRGPYGRPGGTSDIPDGADVEGDDRANVVTEDEEWIIQRDSRSTSSPQRYRVKHKDSGAEIVVESDDHVRLGREAATEALVLGTSYRTAERSFMIDFIVALSVFATALADVGIIDPGVKAAATALITALNNLLPDPFLDDTQYLSDKVFTE